MDDPKPEKAGRKPAYEPPRAVPLSELARGSGKCNAGGSVTPGNCGPGANAQGSCKLGGAP